MDIAVFAVYCPGSPKKELIHEYLRIVFPAMKLKPVFVSQSAVKAVIAVVVAFWVLRNVPSLSFLAP